MKKLFLLILLLPSLALAEPSLRDDGWAKCTGTISDTTSTSINAANAKARHFITSYTVRNLHATTAVGVDLLDGSTVKWTCPAAAAGGGCTITFPVPIVGTTNTALNCQPSGSATIQCCAAGFDTP